MVVLGSELCCCIVQVPRTRSQIRIEVLDTTMLIESSIAALHMGHNSNTKIKYSPFRAPLRQDSSCWSCTAQRCRRGHPQQVNRCEGKLRECVRLVHQGSNQHRCRRHLRQQLCSSSRNQLRDYDEARTVIMDTAPNFCEPHEKEDCLGVILWFC